jgi:hypothetical protein
LPNIDPELLIQRQEALQATKFSSLRLQITGVTDLGNDVESILELGPGSGFFSTNSRMLGYNTSTADIDPDYSPDYLGDIRELKISEKFDLVASFEVLQHLPFDDVGEMIKKLAALSNKYVFLSVPSRVHYVKFGIALPAFLTPRGLGFGWLYGWKSAMFTWEWPLRSYPPPETWQDRKDYWKPHYWEAGRKQYPKKRVLAEIKNAGLEVIWARHNPDHPHYFFIMAKKVS